MKKIETDQSKWTIVDHLVSDRASCNLIEMDRRREAKDQEAEHRADFDMRDELYERLIRVAKEQLKQQKRVKNVS